MPTGSMKRERKDPRQQDPCIECTAERKHISHFNLQEAIGLVQELQVPEAYFTISATS